MNIKSKIAKVTLIFVLTLLVGQIASAETTRVTASSTLKAGIKAEKMEKVVTKAKSAGDSAIQKRLDDLNKLSLRVQEMKKISADSKMSITNSINSLILELTNLKAKIDSDTSTTTLKADRDAITKQYRIYALVVPKVNIMAAGDRINTMADLLTTFVSKIEVRLGNASTTNPLSSTELSTIQTNLADLKTRINTARIDAGVAVSGVLTLVPDNGDKNMMTSNTASLKAAKEKIKSAHTSLLAAHKDATLIVKTLSKKDSVPKTASSTTSTRRQ